MATADVPSRRTSSGRGAPAGVRWTDVRVWSGVLVANVVLIGWTYAPAVDSYLIADDFQWLSTAMEYPASQAFRVAGQTHFYRPIPGVYFDAMHAWFGCSAAALHIGSLAVHLANAVLVMALVLAVTGRRAVAALASLVFAVQPAPAEAVLWPSAVSALLAASFGLVMLILDRTRPPDAGTGRAIAVAAAFAIALGCHESAVMFLPAAWILGYGAGARSDWRTSLRAYGPSLIVLAAYLALAVWINSRNYVVTEGYYRPGAHMLTNLMTYLVSLWAGRRQPLDYAISMLVLLVLIGRGRTVAAAWAVWMVIALVPVLPFDGTTASRYTYVASIPFSCLLAAGVAAAYQGVKGSRTSGRRLHAARAIAGALAVFVLGRSALFAAKGAEGFERDAAAFERIAQAAGPSPASVVTVDAATVEWMDSQYLLPLVRVAACDADVSVRVE